MLTQIHKHLRVSSKYVAVEEVMPSEITCSIECSICNHTEEFMMTLMRNMVMKIKGLISQIKTYSVSSKPRIESLSK